MPVVNFYNPIKYVGKIRRMKGGAPAPPADENERARAIRERRRVLNAELDEIMTNLRNAEEGSEEQEIGERERRRVMGLLMTLNGGLRL